MDALTPHTLAATEPQIVLAVRNLCVRDRRTRAQLSGPVNFDLHAGECVALVGPSGCGKSLTLRALLGLLPDELEATFDRFEVLGTSLSRASEASWNAIRGATIGLIQQDTGQGLDPLQSVLHAVLEASRVHHTLGAQSAPEKAQQLLNNAGFDQTEDLLSRLPDELSGGMRQRVLIASALSAEPVVVCADEPTTALDARTQAVVLSHLIEEKSAGKALVMVSHDRSVVGSIADQIVWMGPEEPARLVPTEEMHTDSMRLSSSGSRGERGSEHEVQNAVLRVTGLSARYAEGGGIDDVSFDLNPGRTLGVLGESGAGKSTLARAIIGLMQPHAGEVTISDELWVSHSQLPKRSAKWQVQWVPQDALASFPRGVRVNRLITEAIVLSRKLRGEPRLPKIDVRNQVRTLLNMVGLPAHVAETNPRLLSGGQRQRVSIARALAMKPRVLICDESVSALDPDARDGIVLLLGTLARSEGLAIVFISHDLDVISQIADDVLVLRAGQVIEQGAVREVFAHPTHEFTRELLSAHTFVHGEAHDQPQNR